MAEGKTRKFDLGKDGSINCYVSENEKRVLITFEVDEKGVEQDWRQRSDRMPAPCR